MAASDAGVVGEPSSLIEPMTSGCALVGALTGPPPADSAASVWRLGQAGVAIRFSAATVFVDLYLSNHCEAVLARPFDHRRMTRAPLDAAELTMADLVICTHDHLDHLDVPTLRTIGSASPRAVAIVPAAARARLAELDWPTERVIGTHDGDQVSAAGLSVTAFAAAHERWDVDALLGHPYQGFVITDGAVTVAHVGDALAAPESADAIARHRPDVLFLPINGRDAHRASMGFAGNMSAEEAAMFARATGARTVIPMHYDMFAQNVDDDAVDRFRRACADAQVRAVVLQVGEPWSVRAAPRSSSALG